MRTKVTNQGIDLPGGGKEWRAGPMRPILTHGGEMGTANRERWSHRSTNWHQERISGNTATVTLMAITTVTTVTTAAWGGPQDRRPAEHCTPQLRH
jgi:hypothetical protein